jgi:hypothetical protein
MEALDQPLHPVGRFPFHIYEATRQCQRALSTEEHAISIIDAAVSHGQSYRVWIYGFHLEARFVHSGYPGNLDSLGAMFLVSILAAGDPEVSRLGDVYARLMGKR